MKTFDNLCFRIGRTGIFILIHVMIQCITFNKVNSFHIFEQHKIEKCKPSSYWGKNLLQLYNNDIQWQKSSSENKPVIGNKINRENYTNSSETSIQKRWSDHLTSKGIIFQHEIRTVISVCIFKQRKPWTISRNDEDEKEKVLLMSFDKNQDFIIETIFSSARLCKVNLMKIWTKKVSFRFPFRKLASAVFWKWCVNIECRWSIGLILMSLFIDV